MAARGVFLSPIWGTTSQRVDFPQILQLPHDLTIPPLDKLPGIALLPVVESVACFHTHLAVVDQLLVDQLLVDQLLVDRQRTVVVRQVGQQILVNAFH